MNVINGASTYKKAAYDVKTIYNPVFCPATVDAAERVSA